MRARLCIFAVIMVIGVSGLLLTPLNVVKTTHWVDAGDHSICYNLYIPEVLDDPTPVVVIGHGVNVNKEMMENVAVDLAHNGFIVAALDWEGHGRSTGELSREGLIQDVEAVIADIPQHTSSADMGRLALIGYSMGGYPTFQYAGTHSTVKAWVGIGTAGGDSSSLTNPRNVLIVIAAHDEAVSLDRVKEALVPLTGLPLEEVETDTLYGSMSLGNARKIDVIPFTDHLISPWHPAFVSRAVSWIAETFETPLQPSVFYLRILFLLVGLFGFLGFFYDFSPALCTLLCIERDGEAVDVTVSLRKFIGKYFLVTLALLPSLILFLPLFLAPLPFTAFVTTLTGGLGVNLFVFSRLLAGKKMDLKKNFSMKIWAFSVILTAIFIGCYYLLVGLHFLGMVPSSPKIPFSLMYVVLLFFVFLSYSFFIQKISTPVLRKRVRSTSVVSVVNFIFVYSWFVIVVLIPCILVDNYFLAQILVIMVPIFLFMSFFCVYMEKVTGSVVPSAVLHAVWLGLVTTTLTPYGYGFML